MDRGLVLVTGGSGYIGSYCIIKCLNEGYHVRTTVRSLKRKPDVHDMLKTGGIKDFDKLSFVEADLNKDEGWKEAVEGCKYVLHVASPFPPGPPKHEDDLIIPACQGATRILKYAEEAGVKRVVLTSSVAAISTAHKNWDPSKPFTEETWSPVENIIDAYSKSKTLAERAAWDYMEKSTGNLELVAVNPCLVFGPVLNKDHSTSIEVVNRLMSGSMPGCPHLTFNVIDVRDVADMHFLAMEAENAKGERFICASTPCMSIKDIAVTLRENLGHKARRVPTRELPDFLIRIGAWFDPSMRLIVSELGNKKDYTHDKATKLLGWNPRSNRDAIVATAESLLEMGFVKP